MPAPPSSAALQASSSTKSPGPPPVFGSCRLELHDFKHAVRREPKTRRLLRLATGVGGGACLASLALLSTSHLRAGILLGVLGLLSFAAHNLPDTVAQRWFRRTPLGARDSRFTLSDQGLIVATEISQHLYPWRELYAFHSTASSHLVWVSPKLFLVLPKRAFKPEDQPVVDSWLRRQIGAGAPPTGMGPRLVLLAALGLGAWALWNALSPPPSQPSTTNNSSADRSSGLAAPQTTRSR